MFLPSLIGFDKAGFGDPDYLAFYNRVVAAGGSLTATEQAATQQLVLDLKGYSIWTKMKAIYPMVGGGTGTTAARQAACSQNLVSSSFTGTFTATGWTFASTGVTPNGTSAYMNTNFNPSLQLTNSSGHFSYYSRTNTAAGAKYEMGCYNGTSGNGVVARYSSDVFYAVYGAYNATFTNTNSQGFYITNRNSTTNTTGFKNNTKVINTVSTGFAANKILFLAANNSISIAEFNDRECALSSIGDGLTDTEASNFYTAVQAFQTTLSRQV